VLSNTTFDYVHNTILNFKLILFLSKHFFSKNLVSIYNRLGNLIYQSKTGQYETTPWDGKYNDENMPVGSYYFVIEFNDNFTGNKTGIVTLTNN